MSDFRNLSSYGASDEKTAHILVTVIRSILHYYVFLITIVIYNSALFLRNDFVTLKNFLKNSVIYSNGQRHIMFLFKPITKIASAISNNEDNSFQKIFESSKIVNLLFECMEVFNHMFGLVIVLLNFLTVITILAALNNLLVSSDTDQLRTSVILDCLCQFSIFLVSR